MPIWESDEFDQHEQVCCFSDPAHGLKAIVAIHSTAFGPAAGGTRFRSYSNDQLALDDALRLSRAMSYKCALADAPLGGGKAVIIGDPAKLKTRGLLHVYGRFLNRIGNVFCTGEDVGMSLADCEVLREVCPFVAGTDSGGSGDPSVYTSKGVFYGMRAVIEARLDTNDFDGVHVAVQGLGSVGMRLCGLLHEAGARLTVADIRPELVNQASRQFGARVVSADAIHSVDADVFAPCAMGGGLNPTTVDQIKAKAVAGAANNQLASIESGEKLHRRGILYAPDYVINAGGVVGLLEEIARIPGRQMIVTSDSVDARLRKIEERLRDIFARSSRERAGPELVALRMAQELIKERGRTDEQGASTAA